MSSRCSFSLYQLCAIILERREHLVQLCENRFTPQKTRLQQHLDQTGVLTTEQEDINKRVSVVSDDFEDLEISMFLATQLFKLYEHQLIELMFNQKVQPKRSYIRIEALFAEVGVKLQHLEGRLRELEGIDVTDSQ